MSDAAAHATITLAQTAIPDRAASAPAPAARALHAQRGHPQDVPDPSPLNASTN
jgi:hypothetical protein